MLLLPHLCLCLWLWLGLWLWFATDNLYQLLITNAPYLDIVTAEYIDDHAYESQLSQSEHRICYLLNGSR